MSTSHWLRAKEILGDLAGTAPDDRAGRIAAACDGDAGLRAEVERLLALDDEAGLYFGELQSMLSPVDAAPEQIGVYRIVREIGRGGMGTVYLGERSDGQFEQRVAIKVVRDGVAGRLLERFRGERRILAQLEHPGIAYLLDGGSLPDGRPYFVMEHVDGESITAYADRKRLSITQRLQLFRKTCAAVAYAHRNLVVHRDLKPGNVMVEEDDQGQASIKLLDFGIAKILQEDIDDSTQRADRRAATSSMRKSDAGGTTLAPLVTEHGDRLLTPLYAAPEQIRGEPATTAADVYALGVLLYELLTGARPFATASTQREMERAILEDSPTAPSSVVVGSNAEVAAARASDSSRLARRMRGDLDSIVFKALRKQPERRYASVGQLSDDIKRHLAGMAVTTRRNSWPYRLGIFLRRHRWGVAVTSAALLAGLSLAALHVTRITQERDRARAAAAKAEEVSQLLIGMFESADPANARGEEVSVREVLDRASGKIDELANQPAVQAQMIDIMGGIYARLGEYDTADAMLRRGLALRRELYGPRHPDVADSMQNLAVLAWMRGRHDRAERLLREVLDQRLEFRGPNSLEVAQVRNDLAAVLRQQGKLAESEALYRQAIAVRRAQLGDHHPDVVSSRNNLAVLLGDLGRFDAAEALYRQVLDSRRKTLGPIHPQIANTLANLAELLRGQQRFDEAETLVRKALAMRLALYDDTHPRVAATLSMLGGTLRGQGRYDEAETYYRKALKLRRKAFGDRHQRVASSLNNLANLYRDRGKYPQAEPLYREAIAIYRERLGPDHRWTATSIKNLGELLLQAGSPHAAEAQLREALRIRELAYPDDHWQVAEARSLLGAALARQGLFDAAAPLLREAHATLQQARGKRDTLTQDALARLVAAQRARDGDA